MSLVSSAAVQNSIFSGFPAGLSCCNVGHPKIASVSTVEEAILVTGTYQPTKKAGVVGNSNSVPQFHDLEDSEG
ncbi:hypothetical protein TNCT_289611 [Trichonephila clavata]|uniref:Uncharacterized protein n=1 Tax=Trichonephila clavata TaxID=2740835 RepID=A0A8X6GJN8_TRICU|nr:hypothetical protein TNCT_289611 [Trichonephila clavata]